MVRPNQVCPGCVPGSAGSWQDGGVEPACSTTSLRPRGLGLSPAPVSGHFSSLGVGRGRETVLGGSCMISSAPEERGGALVALTMSSSEAGCHRIAADWPKGWHSTNSTGRKSQGAAPAHWPDLTPSWSVPSLCVCPVCIRDSGASMWELKCDPAHRPLLLLSPSRGPLSCSPPQLFVMHT